jgi:hypothetical protein
MKISIKGKVCRSLALLDSRLSSEEKKYKENKKNETL